jgi:tetrahydromethanopterin S-methyltransferase subunit G
MNSFNTIKAESEDLATHVELCAQRYKELDDRLDKLESKVDRIVETMNNFKSDIKKTLITTGGTIIVTLITTLGVIYTKF